MNQKELTQAIRYFKRRGVIDEDSPETQETWDWVVKAEFISYRLRFYFTGLHDTLDAPYYHVKRTKHGFYLDTEANPDFKKLQDTLDSTELEPSAVHVLFSSTHLQPKRVQERYLNNRHHLETRFGSEFVEYGCGYVEYKLLKSHNVDFIEACVQTLRTFSLLSNEHTVPDIGIDHALARN